MAKSIYYWLEAGKPVIANFEIDINKVKKCRGEFYYLDNTKLTPDNLVNFARYYAKDHKCKEGSIRLYVDEAQLIFNSRDWMQSDRGSWLSFMSQHRKYFYDIYLIAQFDRMIDRQIRSLIEYEYIHRKVDNYGIGGLIVKIIMLGHPTFCAVKFWYPLKERLSAEFFLARKKYYSIYDTFYTFDEFKNPSLPADFVAMNGDTYEEENDNLQEEGSEILKEELS